jgi:hypothetical protein
MGPRMKTNMPTPPATRPNKNTTTKFSAGSLSLLAIVRSPTSYARAERVATFDSFPRNLLEKWILGTSP